MELSIRLNKEELKKWLASAIGVVLISISLSNSSVEINSNIQSPKKIYDALLFEDDYFSDGDYVVKYEKLETKKISDETIPYSRYAMAFTALASLKIGDKIGGLELLIKSLSRFNIITKINKEPNNTLNGHILIELPVNPLDLEELQSILEEYSIMYVFPDGSNQIHEGNLRFGNGLSVQHKTT